MFFGRVHPGEAKMLIDKYLDKGVEHETNDYDRPGCVDGFSGIRQ